MNEGNCLPNVVPIGLVCPRRLTTARRQRRQAVYEEELVTTISRARARTLHTTDNYDAITRRKVECTVQTTICDWIYIYISR